MAGGRAGIVSKASKRAANKAAAAERAAAAASQKAMVDSEISKIGNLARPGRMDRTNEWRQMREDRQRHADMRSTFEQNGPVYSRQDMNMTQQQHSASQKRSAGLAAEERRILSDEAHGDALLVNKFRDNGFSVDESIRGLDASKHRAGDNWGGLGSTRQEASMSDNIFRGRAEGSLSSIGIDMPNGTNAQKFVMDLRRSGAIDDDAYRGYLGHARNGSSADDIYSNVVGRRAELERESFVRGGATARQQRQAEFSGALEAGNAPSVPSAAGGGGSSVQEASMRKGGKDFSSQYNYVTKQQGQNYDYDNIMKGYTDPSQANQRLANLTGKSMDEVGNMSQDSLRAELGAALHRRASAPTFGDKMGYHKVPQTAVGVGATAFLVSKMTESKGQMSNSQLYGQSSPYGM